MKYMIKGTRRHIAAAVFTCLLLLVLLAIPVQAGSRIVVRFMTADGAAASENILLKPGKTITLPEAPEGQVSGKLVLGSSAWKPASAYKSGMETFPSGGKLTYEKASALLSQYGDGETLTFYAAKLCRIRYFTNTGSDLLYDDYAYEGSTISLRNSPYTDTAKYKGWTLWKGTSRGWASFGASFEVTGNKTLYVRELVKLGLLESGGAAISTKWYLKGTEVTLPAPAAKDKYITLGWSSVRGASQAEYTAGTTLSMKEDLTLYAIRKYVPYQVTFTNNNGTSTAAVFTSLNRRTGKETIILPALPKMSGYVGLGWTDTVKSKNVVWKAGDSVRITKNTVFYAVYRKAREYTVKFYMEGGSTNADYLNLKMTVQEGSRITLPEVPWRIYYTNKGWSLHTAGTTKTYKAGATLRVYGNLIFYSIQEKEDVSVILKNADGSTFRIINTSLDGSVVLPSKSDNAEGYTFIGWDPVRGKKANPKYEAQVRLNHLQSNVTLYEVRYSQTTEPSLGASALGGPNAARYSRVIIIGDSRTHYMSQALAAEGYANDRVEFICRSGMRLNWLRNAAWKKLKARLDEVDSTSGLPVAVVFNLGVNDIYDGTTYPVSQYITFLNNAAAVLQEKNCRLFFMSINPVNSETRKEKIAINPTLILHEEAQVRLFNKQIKAGTAANYTYIDMYGFLVKNGYNTQDGLHYMRNTSKRIFAELMKQINKT